MHFDHFGRLPGLVFDGFDSVLYRRFKKVRISALKYNEV